jgi:hypothetical protein
LIYIHFYDILFWLNLQFMLKWRAVNFFFYELWFRFIRWPNSRFKKNNNNRFQVQYCIDGRHFLWSSIRPPVWIFKMLRSGVFKFFVSFISKIVLVMFSQRERERERELLWKLSVNWDRFKGLIQVSVSLNVFVTIYF